MPHLQVGASTLPLVVMEMNRGQEPPEVCSHPGMEAAVELGGREPQGTAQRLGQ